MTAARRIRLWQDKQQTMRKKGALVECIEKPGWLTGVTRGKVYIVNGVQHGHGVMYYHIRGDDGVERALLSDMFRHHVPRLPMPANDPAI